MRSDQRRLLFLSCGVALGAAFFNARVAKAATSGINPASTKITIYGIALSANTDCSNAFVVANFGPAGQQVDFLQAPPLASANIPAGTYPCMILKLSDVISFVPAQTSDNGYCTAGVAVTRDICRAGGGTYTPTTFNADGTVTYGTPGTACTGSLAAPSNDSPALFLSTSSTNTNGSGAFAQPTSSAYGFNLGAPFVVTGSSSGTFVINFSGQVKESGTQCDMGPAIFTFR